MQRWLAACVAVPLMLAAFAAPALAQYAVASITPWKADAAPMGWSKSLNRVLYNSQATNGVFNAYSANPDGSNPQCVSCAVPGVPAGGQRGVSDVSPDGNYMLLEVEGNHPGLVGQSMSEPGKGAYDDVWLASTDGQQAWPLTSVVGTSTIGTMWARFDRTGTRIVWAEMYAPAFFNLGYWRLKVANVTWTGGIPSLTNVQTIEPQPYRFMEPYGFTPDNQHVVFASDVNQPYFWDSQIWTIGSDGTDLTRITQGPTTGFFSNYNEFAFYTPAGDAIIYGSTYQAWMGMEYRVMAPDGSAPQQLTHFNDWTKPEFRNYTVVGGLVFNPNNPDQLIAGISGSVLAEGIDAVTITLTGP